MKIAIDTNALYTTRAGMARYVGGLLQGFRELAPPGLEIFETAWRVENFSYRQPARAIKTAYRELFWSRYCAPRILLDQEASLLHATSNLRFVPPRSVKHVITLYDLAILRYPRRFRKWQRFAVTRFLADLPKADRIICISRFTAEEAMKLCGLPASKLEVIYCGCDLGRDDTPATSETSYDIPSEFFLFVGSLEPGKNLALLREVYELARTRNIALPSLLIVGERWRGVASEGPAPGNWVYLGRQPDTFLVRLYRSAIALVFPSKYEGFGFPVLEAMRSDCPVICSSVASLPEVAGDAGIYAPQTPEGYLDAMTGILASTPLRDERVSKGRVHAGKFTWRACAEQTLQVYREVLSRA